MSLTSQIFSVSNYTNADWADICTFEPSLDHKSLNWFWNHSNNSLEKVHTYLQDIAPNFNDYEPKALDDLVTLELSNVKVLEQYLYGNDDNKMKMLVLKDSVTKGLRNAVLKTQRAVAERVCALLKEVLEFEESSNQTQEQYEHLWDSFHTATLNLTTFNEALNGFLTLLRGSSKLTDIASKMASSHSRRYTF